MEKINYSQASLNDLIFEGRNKQYGAYDIRRIYDEYVLRAAGIAIFGFALVILAPIIWEKIKPEEEVVVDNTPLTDPKLVEPPPIDPKTPPPPPAVATPPPPAVSTVRFVPPEVVPEEEVTEEAPPDQKQLETAVASTVTAEGDPNANPDELNLDQVGTGSGDVIGAPPEPEPEFAFVEQDPQPPGGDLQAYFAKNIKYPQKAINQDIEGKVFVTFVVTSAGDVDDVKLLKGIGYGCDEEAIRVVKSMPKWTPGKNGGREVKVRMNIPIVFKLAR